MRLLKCPKKEVLFELVSIPGELGTWHRLGLRVHTSSCAGCRRQMEVIRSEWESVFSPEPELTSSLIRVYSRLQNDETLILKGWKLSEMRSRGSAWGRLFGQAVRGGWLFRGAFSLGLGLLAVFAVSTRSGPRQQQPPAATPVASANPGNLPWAQIRIEDKNRIQVHYVRPELLQSMEFETVSATR